MAFEQDAQSRYLEGDLLIAASQWLVDEGREIPSTSAGIAETIEEQFDGGLHWFIASRFSLAEVRPGNNDGVEYPVPDALSGPHWAAADRIDWFGKTVQSPMGPQPLGGYGEFLDDLTAGQQLRLRP